MNNNSQLVVHTHAHTPYCSDNCFITQEQSIFSKIHDNVYQTRITGIENKLLSKFCIKITLPEIRGAGQVAYVKNYMYSIFKQLQIKIINYDGTIVELPTLTGYDLFRLAKQNQFIADHIKSMNKKNCKTRNGDKGDTVIFKMKDIHSHLELPFDSILLQRSAYIDITLQLEPEDTIITYNSEFEPHLLTYLNEAETFAKNIVLQYNVYKGIEDYRTKVVVFNRNESSHGTCLTVTNDFQAAHLLNIYAKPETLSTKQKYLMNPAAIEDRDKLIMAAIDNFKDDLITTEVNESNKKNYILIPDNGIVVFKKSQKRCFINILNKPNIPFYYHSKILSYSRRNDIAHNTNVSEMFQEIKVLYTKEKLIIDVVSHIIPVWVACIPISFWSHSTNTSSGDMRSETSKAKDFFYQNKFTTSIDFLNITHILESVTLSSQQIKYKANSSIQTCFVKENNIEIPLCIETKPILPEPHRLENFALEIKTKPVDRHSIRDLYRYKIIDEVIEKKYLQTTSDQKIVLSISPN